jgi:ABC-type nickel/cobalt efflux system permease component RcnA
MRRAVVAIVVLAVLIVAATAEAHPLGNFTINHYAGIEVAGRTTYVHFALDVAEVPTVQIGGKLRAATYPRTLARSLDLRLDGARAPLEVVSRRISSRPGAGGLATLRLDVVYRALATGSRIAFEDRSFGGHIGWREVTLRVRDGAGISSASVPTESRSDELRAYPKDLLRSPLDVRSATAVVELGDVAGPPPSIDPSAAPDHRGGGFESLISRRHLSAGVVFVSLLIAAFWGAAHALTPGHGKSLVAGYLIGTKGRPRDAVLLGATVTITHTIGVFALGLVTLALSAFIVPERLYPWLTLVSGLLVVGVGAAVLVRRVRSGGWSEHTHAEDDGHHHHHDDAHHHDHDHAHPHVHHDHHHAHDVDERMTRRNVIGVGVAAGLLPCPSALVVLLGAIALHRVGFGLALIVAFSLGLAATITSLGLVVVLARGALGRFSFDGRIVRALPAVSALVIIGVGIALTVKAVPNLA